jgi:hypothetical protein
VVAGAVVAGLLLALFTGGAAQATITNPGGPPDNSGTWRFGVPLTQFGDYSTFTSLASCPTGGGWLGGGSSANANHFVTVGQPSAGPSYQPSSVCVGEPMYWAGHGIYIPGLLNYLKDNQPGALPSRFESTSGGAGTNAATPVEVGARCQSTQYAKGSAGFDVLPTVNGGSSAASSVASNGVNVYTGFGALPNVNTGNCPFLVYLQVYVGIYDHSTTPTWSTWIWYADNARTNVAYPKYDPNGDICKDPQASATNPIGQDCPWVAPGTITDPTDPKQVCANPPSFAAADLITFFNNFWPTFGYWSTFWAKCMFVPAGGFDRLGTVATAWAASPFSAAASAIGGLQSALAIPETCGPLVTGGGGSWSSLNINTCSWAAFGAQVKPYLGIVISLMFGWWAIGFVVFCVTGILTKKIPSPVKEEK